MRLRQGHDESRVRRRVIGCRFPGSRQPIAGLQIPLPRTRRRGPCPGACLRAALDPRRSECRRPSNRCRDTRPLPIPVVLVQLADNVLSFQAASLISADQHRPELVIHLGSFEAHSKGTPRIPSGKGYLSSLVAGRQPLGQNRIGASRAQTCLAGAAVFVTTELYCKGSVMGSGRACTTWANDGSVVFAPASRIRAK